MGLVGAIGILSWLESIAEWVRCLVDSFVCFVINGAIGALNLVIVGLAAVVTAAVDGWPIDMPDMPAMPAEVVTGAGWAAWFFPVATAVTVLLFILTATIAWWVLAIILRWAKAIGD